MQKLERLINLVAALLETERPLTRVEIRERVPGYGEDGAGFHRMFERDKNSLRSMGIPLRVEELPGVEAEGEAGYIIDRDEYAMADPGLTREEMDALGLAASVVRLADAPLDGALGKLGGTNRQLRASQDRSAIELTNDERLAVAFSARASRSVAHFSYNGKQRAIEIARFSFRYGRWYLHGWDRSVDERRTFRMDRVEGEITPGPSGAYEPPTTSEALWLPPWQMGEDEPVTVQLWVATDYVAVCQRLAPHANVVTEQGDGTVFSFTVTNELAFRSFVVEFLDKAEVVSPKPVRERFVAWVRDTLAHHEMKHAVTTTSGAGS